MKFDEILDEVGEFGPYQRRVYVLVCLAAIMSSFQTMLPVFTLDIPDYRCKIPEMDNDTYEIQSPYHEQLVNMSIPMVANDNGEMSYSSCYVYGSMNSSIASQPANQSQSTCEEYVYDKSVFQTTALTQYNLVCGAKTYRSHLNMVGFGGMLFSAITFGIITDMAGRKISLISGCVIMVVAGVSLGFAPSFIAFAVLRFFTGISAMATFMISFVLGLEMVGPSKRTIAGIAIEFFWCLGLFILVAVAYFIRTWNYLQITLSVPAVCFIAYWWIIPESPRWLISQGRMAEAEVVLQKLAKKNGRTLPKDVMKRIKLDEAPQMKIWHMFTAPVLIVRALVIFYNWFAINIIYYGLSLNVGNLSGNVYLNFTVSSAVETAAYAMCLLLLERTGRKKLFCVSMMIGGLACIATLFPVVYGNNSMQWLTVTLAMVGKFGASAAFGIIYVFSAEIFPTVVRQSGIGACSIFEGIGGMVAPYISDLGIIFGGQFAEALPLIVFGCITVSAGLLSLLLPETKDRKLPETIEDAINFGKDDVRTSQIYVPVAPNDANANEKEITIDTGV